MSDYVCGRCGTEHEKQAYGPGYAKVCPDCGSYDQGLTTEARERVGALTFKAQSARDAQASIVRGGNSFDESYCVYLDQAAQEHYDYFMERGDTATAALMLTQSLGEALRGNDGD